MENKKLQNVLKEMSDSHLLIREEFITAYGDVIKELEKAESSCFKQEPDQEIMKNACMLLNQIMYESSTLIPMYEECIHGIAMYRQLKGTLFSLEGTEMGIVIDERIDKLIKMHEENKKLEI
jgi:hypothetical protein